MLKPVELEQVTSDDCQGNCKKHFSDDVGSLFAHPSVLQDPSDEHHSNCEYCYRNNERCESAGHISHRLFCFNGQGHQIFLSLIWESRGFWGLLIGVCLGVFIATQAFLDVIPPIVEGLRSEVVNTHTP